MPCLVQPERVTKVIKRRTNVAGIFRDEPAIERLVGAPMPEPNDEWTATGSYMTLETVVAICKYTTIDPTKVAAL